MEGVINNFRRGRHTTSSNQMIVVSAGVDSKEKAEKLIGKKVTWKSPGDKQISGKISAAHGSRGAFRVVFDTGMPGQAIGSKVKIE